MKSIFKVSSEIKEMSLFTQKQTKGGNWQDSRLSTIVIIPGDNGGGWSWGDFSFTDPTSNYGGGGGTGSGGTGDDTNVSEDDNINDPHKVLDAFEENLKTKISMLKEHMKTNIISQDKGQQLMDAYEKVQNAIDIMKESTHKYRIEVIPNFDNNDKVNSGEFIYDKATGEYVVRVEGVEGKYEPVFVHELVHVTQFENGELDFDKSGNPADYDIQDEVEAYQMQEYFDKGQLFQEVTPDSIWKDYPGIYDHLKPVENNGGGMESLSSESRS